MDKYAHRHTLHTDDENLHPRNSERARVIRACFNLASLAHAGESREKINPTIDYISHPIMAYDMLNELGETDVVLLGAAFLHDVLELKESAYFTDPDLLRRQLLVELEKEGIRPARAEELAQEIFDLVEEVTNPVERLKAKELLQVDHAQDMSLRAKKLKIVDQCASFICNVMLDNDPELIPYEKEREFKEKGESVCYALLDSAKGEDRIALQKYADFFQSCRVKVDGLFLPPNATDKEILRQRMDVRHHFHFYELFTGPTKLEALPPIENATFEKIKFYDEDHLPDELESGKPLGLLQVEFNEQGRVSKCYLHVSQDPSKSNEINQLQDSFHKEIRKRLRYSGQYVESGKDPLQPILLPGQLTQDGNIRVYTLMPAMYHYAFREAALDAQVCNKKEWALIGKIGEGLHKEYEIKTKVPALKPAPRVVQKTEAELKQERLTRLARRSWDSPRER